MTDTWKDIIGRINDVASSISPEDDGGALISELGAIVQAIRSESASSDAKTRLRLDALTGERAADEERLRQAGARVGIWYGCDTPDWLAEEILGLRARLDALEAEHQRLKAVDTPEPWADVFAASKRLVDSPSYAVGAFRALVARAYDWEVAAKARLQAQLTLAESSRASLEAENKELRNAAQAKTRFRGSDGTTTNEPPCGPICASCSHPFSEHNAITGLGECYERIATGGICQCRGFRPSSPSAQEPT